MFKVIFKNNTEKFGTGSYKGNNINILAKKVSDNKVVITCTCNGKRNTRISNTNCMDMHFFYKYYIVFLKEIGELK